MREPKSLGGTELSSLRGSGGTFPLFKVRRAEGIFFRRFRQSRLDRLAIDLFLMGKKIPLAGHPNIREPLLPDCASKTKFLSGSKRKIALDQLHCIFKSHVAIDREEKVDMIPHYYEVVHLEFSRLHV